MAWWLAMIASAASADPACLVRGAEELVQQTIARGAIPDDELLARLVNAESVSTGFPEDPLVYEAIAWGVMNRVRLGERSAHARKAYGDGIAGVVFKPGQFNPAVSTRSKFQEEFLCPSGPTWSLATAAATEALGGVGNPFVTTEWERTRGVALVVNFYYPSSVQAKGPLAPWESSTVLTFIGDIVMADGTLSPDRVRFYRLATPPHDWMDPIPSDR